MIDPLTKIPSIEDLNEQLEKAKHPKLFLIDIKDFKHTNITYSDEAGDFILCSFANALQEFANKNEMLCFRVLDDEFALFKDTPFDLSSMEKIVFDLSDFITTQKYKFEGNTFDIEAHMGICLDHTNALKKAMSALDLAQKEDQPFVTYSEFATKMLEQSEEEIGTAIKQSMKDGSTNPYFQRVIDLDGNNIFNETLIRIMSKNSIQSPKFFLTIAHKRGFYPSIMKLLIEKIATIKGKKSINLSYADMFDDHLFDFLIDTLKDDETIFELHADNSVQIEVLIPRLKYIKSKGIKICLDNIKEASILKDFDKHSVDFIKVHGNLIRLLTISESDKNECAQIVNACKALGIKSIATQINSNVTLEEAKKLGFDYYQGFFFGKPSLEFSA